MKKEIFLGFDTTTDSFSVALADSSLIIAQKTVPGRKHSDKLIPVINNLLKEVSVSPEDITAVGMGTGPGSFTGIRVGLSFGITLAQFLKIPAYGISSMDLAGSEGGDWIMKAHGDRYYTASYGREGRRKGPFKIIGSEAAEKLSAGQVRISAPSLAEETRRLYRSGEKGDWKDIEAIYVMQTVYRKKEDRKRNDGEKAENE